MFILIFVNPKQINDNYSYGPISVLILISKYYKNDEKEDRYD
jgi:hypothetical protein